MKTKCAQCSSALATLVATVSHAAVAAADAAPSFPEVDLLAAGPYILAGVGFVVVVSGVSIVLLVRLIRSSKSDGVVPPARAEDVADGTAER